jgi:hypothetical protein
MRRKSTFAVQPLVRCAAAQALWPPAFLGSADVRYLPQIIKCVVAPEPSSEEDHADYEDDKAHKRHRNHCTDYGHYLSIPSLHSQNNLPSSCRLT